MILLQRAHFDFQPKLPPEDDSRASLKMILEQSSNPSPQLKYVIIFEVDVCETVKSDPKKRAVTTKLLKNFPNIMIACLQQNGLALIDCNTSVSSGKAPPETDQHLYLLGGEEHQRFSPRLFWDILDVVLDS